MESKAFPGCCNGHVLFNFGETKNSLWVDDSFNLEEFESDLDWYIETYERYMLLATTNNEQVQVNRVLANRGFICSAPMHKDAHPDTLLYLWYRKPVYNEKVIKEIWGKEM